MKLKLVILGLLLTLGLAGCASNTGETGSNELGFVAADGSAVLLDVSQRNDPVDLEFPLVSESDTWQLSDARGQVVVLYAWGPWCAPCRKELPELQELQDELGAQGLQIVGLATRTTRTAVEAFIRQRNITYPQLADYDSLVISSLSGVPSTTVPGSIFIDRQGRVAGWSLGAADPVLLESLMKSLLEESP